MRSVTRLWYKPYDLDWMFNPRTFLSDLIAFARGFPRLFSLFESIWNPFFFYWASSSKFKIMAAALFTNCDSLKLLKFLLRIFISGLWNERFLQQEVLYLLSFWSIISSFVLITFSLLLALAICPDWTFDFSFSYLFLVGRNGYWGEKVSHFLSRVYLSRSIKFIKAGLFFTV